MPRDKQKASSRMDMTMLTLVILLTVFGLVILLSASEYNGRVRFHDSAYYFKKQLFASALGLSAMYFVSSIDYHFFVRLAPAAKRRTDSGSCAGRCLPCFPLSAWSVPTT